MRRLIKTYLRKGFRKLRLPAPGLRPLVAQVKISGREKRHQGSVYGGRGVGGV